MSTDTTKVVLSEPEKAALHEDATNRGVRAIWQGLSIDVLVAVALLIVNILTDANGWSDLDWKIIAFTLMKTVLMAIAAFVMRRFVDNSKVPTPLPPSPAPAPTTPAEAPAVEAPDGFVTDPTDLDWPEDPSAVVGEMPDGVDIPGGEPAEGDTIVGPPPDLERPVDEDPNARGGL